MDERARELISNLSDMHWPLSGPYPNATRLVLAFAESVRAEAALAEREACAKVAEDGSFPFDIRTWIESTKKDMTERVAIAIAAAIRARGEK